MRPRTQFTGFGLTRPITVCWVLESATAAHSHLAFDHTVTGN